MTKVAVYDISGNRKEDVSLANELVSEVNLPILAQAIRVFENRQHDGLARTKTRGEIATSTRKIYRQKGTGGARHGAKSAPIFVGGGVAHGPTGDRRILEMPAKMRVRALQVAMGLKAKDGKIVLVDGFDKLTKSKQAKTLVNAIAKDQKDKNSKCVVALSDDNAESIRALRNLKGVTVMPYRNLNAYSVFFGGTIILDVHAFPNAKSKNTAEKKTVSAKKSAVKK